MPLLGNGDEVSQVAQFHVPFYGRPTGLTQRAQSYSIAVGVDGRANVDQQLSRSRLKLEPERMLLRLNTVSIDLRLFPVIHQIVDSTGKVIPKRDAATVSVDDSRLD